MSASTASSDSADPGHHRYALDVGDGIICLFVRFGICRRNPVSPLAPAQSELPQVLISYFISRIVGMVPSSRSVSSVDLNEVNMRKTMTLRLRGRRSCRSEQRTEDYTPRRVIQRQGQSERQRQRRGGRRLPLLASDLIRGT